MKNIFCRSLGISMAGPSPVRGGLLGTLARFVQWFERLLEALAEAYAAV